MTEPLASLSRTCRCALATFASLSLVAILAYPPAVAVAAAESPDGTSYVLLHPGSRSSSMSGSAEDLSRARALRAGSEGLLYVRQGGAAYVIRDAATLRRAEAIFKPQQALGARQAELGSRQAALGARQARLGAEQARLAARQAGGSPSRQQALGRQQEALGRQQNALGVQQDALGRQQSALGREQARLAREAKVKFGALIADALRRGLAQRIN